MRNATIAFRIFCALILVLAVVEIAWIRPSRGAEPAAAAVPTEEHAEKKEDPIAAMPVETADELEDKRKALEDRERELADVERRIKDREKDIDRKLKEMEGLRTAVSGELEGQKKANEERVLKMVQVFETMSPKSSASVMETLDDWLAVDVLKRMDVKKMAKLMNIMDKTRSAKLSELMTGYFRPDAQRNLSSVKTPAQAPSAAPAQAAQTSNAVKPAGQAPAKPADQNPKKGG